MKRMNVAKVALLVVPLLYMVVTLSSGGGNNAAAAPPEHGLSGASLRSRPHSGVAGVRPSTSPSASPAPVPTPSASPAPQLQEVDVSKLKAASHSGCKFEHCPKKSPTYLYLLTPYRNRGSAYNRLLRSLLVDVAGSKETIHPNCVCVTVADYNDTPYGPSVDMALADWPLNAHVVPVKGNFSRAGGLQKLLDNVVTTPPEQSLMFFMDADMIVYPGLVERVVSNSKADGTMFCPIVWSTTGDPEDQYAGKWRSGGTGMIAFYLSDFKRAGGLMPMADKTTYGKEDHEFQVWMRERSGVRMLRDCTPELWHLFHTKRAWSASLDGEVWTQRAKPWAKGDPWKWRMPVADGPAQLRERGDVFKLLCQAAKDGEIYPN